MKFDSADRAQATRDLKGRSLAVVDESEAKLHGEVVCFAPDTSGCDFCNERDALLKSTAYRCLSPDDDKLSGRLATRNIRASLACAFPGVRFTVRRTAISSIIVKWQDGPLPCQVEVIVDRYRAGRYNWVTHAYKYDRSPWGKVFGSARFITIAREASDALVEKAIDIVFAKYAANLAGLPKPDAQLYNCGGLFHVEIPGFVEDLQRLVREEMARLTL